MSWIEVPEGSDFPLENLPFGVFRRAAETPGEARVGVRIGDHVVDLPAAGIAPELTAAASLNPLMASDRGSEVRQRVGELLTGGERADVVHPIADVELLLPIEVVDYVDFYSSIHHATNVGRIFRPDGEPLLPNWRQLPVAYHGRGRTVVVSGTPVARPAGLVPAADGGPARLALSSALDLELEVGFVVGGLPTTHIEPDAADRHVFGVVLMNDWSARDVQAFEYQPLGPHLSKSFATTISPWVVTLDALTPYLVDPPAQEPEPDRYLRARRPWGLDLNLTAHLDDTEICATNFAHMYWTFAQQLAHLTVNGAPAGAGDLYGSGTVSGPTPPERGCLLERTWRGAEPITLADGTTRTFLDDGDAVTIRGWCGGDGRPRVGFGEARGTIVPAPSHAGRD